jgi:tetratricopeptide (TPR) repeat protein
MSFRNDFFDIVGTSNSIIPMTRAESAILNTMDRGLSANHAELGMVRDAVNSGFMNAVERLAEDGAENSRILADEIEMTRQAILETARETVWAIEQAGLYLGARVAEVRWAVEKNTQISQNILDSLWKTHSIESRQYFEEGVQCYETGERELARECFDMAAKACRTNGFAYQYLGFLAVHNGDQDQAIRNFELAAKFLTSDHHKASAHYYLCRAWHAAGDQKASLEHIQAAVGLAPDDLPYHFELVHAQIRAGLTQDALQNLRELISRDIRYWTAAMIDRSLDPIRNEIELLLEQMREETKKAASRILDHFAESVRIIESLPRPDFRSPVHLAPSFDSLTPKRTVFEYQKVIQTIPAKHCAEIEKAMSDYESWLSRVSGQRSNLAARNRAAVDVIRDQIRILTEQAQAVDEHLSHQLGQVESAYKLGKEGGYGCAFGCLGLLAVLGALGFAGVWLILVMNGGPVGTPYTDSTPLHSALLVLPFLLLIGLRRAAFQLRKSGLRAGANSKKSEIQSMIESAETGARRAAAEGAELLKPSEVELGRVSSLCSESLVRLRERLEIARADERLRLGSIPT